MPHHHSRATGRYGTCSNLRNKTTFVSFNDCPDFVELDLRYWSDVTGLPKRNWCLLATVLDATFIGKLVVDVVDAEGTPGQIVITDKDDSGEGFLKGEKRKLKRGYTVAVLYPMAEATWHGVRRTIQVENIEEFTVIPFALNNLREVDERMRKPLPTTCCAEACNQKDNLRNCSQCHIARYCSVVRALSVLDTSGL
ncbi:hypothetical protein K474DRAFT_43950 [Panus rudis PR-1116 ss-1]|nr:hypothetical protein K474DRAFT_43950 [Panus rudis PR-1116 ss-1]